MTASLVLNRTHTFRFVTTDPVNGDAQNADSLPTVNVYEEATDVPILTPTAVNFGTGLYRVDVAITAANGFEAGKVYNVVATATVASVAGAGVIATFQVVTADETQIAAKTDALPPDPADQSLLEAAIAGVQADTDDIQARLPAALVGGRMASNAEVVGDKTGYSLTAAYDPAKTAAQAGDQMALTAAAVDAILDDVVEGALTLRQMIRIILAAVAGKSTGGGVNYRDLADTKNRIAATVDGNGNRTSIVLDGS